MQDAAAQTPDVELRQHLQFVSGSGTKARARVLRANKRLLFGGAPTESGPFATLGYTLVFAVSPHSDL